MSSPEALDIHQSNLLSDGTLAALQLNQQPFAAPAAEATYSDETSAEQLADVKQALITGDDLLLILGERGAGKTVMLGQLGANSGLRIQCFAVKGSPRFSTLNLFAGMLEAFKRKPPELLKDILDDLIPCLQTMVARNTLSAIVLDDADKVTESELTQLLSAMLYVNSQDETLMRVALAAPPEFEDRIPDLLPEGADLPYSSLTIDGMSPPRAADFLTFRLQQAGFQEEQPFDDAEISEMVAQSGGLPQELQAAAAQALNQLHGPVEEVIPAELMAAPSESFLQSRTGKLALGVLATLLIVGGLTMFLPNADKVDERYTTADSGAETTAPELRLVEDNEVTPIVETPDETTAADSTQDPTLATAQNTDTDASTVASLSSTQDSTEDSSDDAANTVSATEADSAGNTPAQASELADAGTISEQITAATQSSNATDSVSESPSAANPVAQSPDAADELQSDADNVATIAAITDTATSEQTTNTESAEPALITDQAGNEETLSDTADVAPDLAGVLESPTWILVQNSSLTTVQMSASRDRASVENFLRRNRAVLPPPNSIYSFVRNGDTWYALLHGLYPSVGAARTAVESLPASAQSNQPWIRNVGRIQDALRSQ